LWLELWPGGGQERLRELVRPSDEVYGSDVQMPKKVSIVDARKELGRLAEDVRRTGQPVVLTRRGRAIARITPEPVGANTRNARSDAFAELRGTVRLNCDLGTLRADVRELRSRFTASLDRRDTALTPRRKRRRA